MQAVGRRDCGLKLDFVSLCGGEGLPNLWAPGTWGKPMRTLLIAMLALVSGAGCSANENIEAVEREVWRFHRLAAGGEFDRLYRESGDELKHSATERDFRDLLQVVNERLGDVQRTNRTGWHVNYTPGGSVVTLTYESQFERGRGVEQFVYRMADQRPQLLGYHINSSALLARPSRREEEGATNETMQKADSD